MNLFLRASFMVMAIGLLPSVSVSAVEPHPYIGVQLGMSFVDLKDTQDSIDLIENVMQTADVDISNSGFSGRLYAGYQFSPFLGFEVGYSKFANSKSNVKSSGNPFITLEVDSVNDTWALDALAVITLPVTNRVAFNLKGGAALIRNHYQAEFFIDGEVTESLSFTSRNFAPKFGAGLDYQITPGFAVGVAYELIVGRGEPDEKFINQGNPSFVPRIQMASINLKYSY